MKPLVQRMRESRMFWVELDSTKKLRVLPPTELEVMEAVSGGKPILDPRNIAAIVHEWKGFTEEDFLGKGIGSTDALALDRDALNEWLSMDIDRASSVVQAVQDVLLQNAEKRKDAEKNSATS